MAHNRGSEREHSSLTFDYDIPSSTGIPVLKMVDGKNPQTQILEAGTTIGHALETMENMGKAEDAVQIFLRIPLKKGTDFDQQSAELVGHYALTDTGKRVVVEPVDEWADRFNLPKKSGFRSELISRLLRIGSDMGWSVIVLQFVVNSLFDPKK